ncbi:MAG TPA: WYL domain-containing protein, partial [Sphingobacteriaceae bacterium]|nr:WYL domain-containing protein [Sphingobacteriaceae bacterium]
MSKRESLSRYNLIINKLRKHPADFKSISDHLERESEIQEYNFKVSKRTFQRDLDDIRSLFHIDVQYDFSRKVYFIDDARQP